MTLDVHHSYPALPLPRPSPSSPPTSMALVTNLNIYKYTCKLAPCTTGKTYVKHMLTHMLNMLYPVLTHMLNMLYPMLTHMLKILYSVLTHVKHIIHLYHAVVFRCACIE